MSNAQEASQYESARARKVQGPRAPRRKYGIGEWYGTSFVRLRGDQRRETAETALFHKDGTAEAKKETGWNPPLCPFRSRPEKALLCSKKGGVCSIRQYVQDRETGLVSAEGTLRATCPNRFLQNDTIFRKVGEDLLDSSEVAVLNQIGFFEKVKGKSTDDENTAYEEVGRIDHVLVHPTRKPLNWCALEIQAVYFSGVKMTSEFKRIRDYAGDGIPFPDISRRPDYRSSSVKRLLPQLMLKVEQLRRWGKMAVVIDRGFFESLSRMEEANDLSSSDVAWFVLDFDETHSPAALFFRKDALHLTTVEKAREALAGGIPVPRQKFEERIRRKLASEYPKIAAALT